VVRSEPCENRILVRITAAIVAEGAIFFCPNFDLQFQC